MNQKSLKYPLLIAVALVWGLIIYKIVNGIGKDDTIKPRTASANKIDYNQPSDSFILMANYPDPFIPKNDSDDVATQPVQSNITVNNATASAPPKPVFDPSIVQYTGMIANPEKKLKVAILNIAGKEYLVKEKEKVNDYFVKSIGKDKVVIIYKGSGYTIERSK